MIDLIKYVHQLGPFCPFSLCTGFCLFSLPGRLSSFFPPGYWLCCFLLIFFALHSAPHPFLDHFLLILSQTLLICQLLSLDNINIQSKNYWKSIYFLFYNIGSVKARTTLALCSPLYSVLSLEPHK